MNIEELEKVLKIKNQRQAAEHFGVHLATVKRAIKKHSIKYSKKSGGHHLYKNDPLDENLKLTKYQRDIVEGSLLGDGFILNSNIFRIKQKSTRKEYIDFIFEKLNPFSTPVRIEKSKKPIRLKDGTVSHKLENWNGEYCFSAMCSTRKHQIFEKLRKKWYPNNKKIIPSDFKLNKTIIKHWYLQDGCHNKKRNYYKFSTQSFSEKEVKHLSKMLNNLLGINSEMKFQEEKPIIMITKTNGERVFSKFIRKDPSFSCFKYKT